MLIFTDCCTKWFAAGEQVCPVCHGQEDATREEMRAVVESSARLPDVTPAARLLVSRRALERSDVGLAPRIASSVTRNNPARRTVFQLLSVWLPEREARELLRNVHAYKWIEAEKAGTDIWRARDPREPFLAAARDWARRHLDSFLQWHERGGQQYA